MKAPPGAPEKTAKITWLLRYAARFVERAGLTQDQANACATADSFSVLSDGFEDDPEGAADEEMSYWDAD